MAQKMLDIANFKLKLSEKKKNFIIPLSDKKNACVRYSKAYKDNVLALTLDSKKSLIITKSMWKELKENFVKIDYELFK